MSITRFHRWPNSGRSGAVPTCMVGVHSGSRFDGAGIAIGKRLVLTLAHIASKPGTRREVKAGLHESGTLHVRNCKAFHFQNGLRLGPDQPEGAWPKYDPEKICEPFVIVEVDAPFDQQVVVPKIGIERPIGKTEFKLVAASPPPIIENERWLAFSLYCTFEGDALGEICPATVFEFPIPDKGPNDGNSGGGYFLTKDGDWTLYAMHVGLLSNQPATAAPKSGAMMVAPLLSWITKMRSQCDG